MNIIKKQPALSRGDLGLGDVFKLQHFNNDDIYLVIASFGEDPNMANSVNLTKNIVVWIDGDEPIHRIRSAELTYEEWYL